MAAVYKWSAKFHGANELPTVTAGIVTVADLAALSGYASKEVDVAKIFDRPRRVGEKLDVEGGISYPSTLRQKNL